MGRAQGAGISDPPPKPWETYRKLLQPVIWPRGESRGRGMGHSDHWEPGFPVLPPGEYSAPQWVSGGRLLSPNPTIISRIHPSVGFLFLDSPRPSSIWGASPDGWC